MKKTYRISREAMKNRNLIEWKKTKSGQLPANRKLGILGRILEEIMNEAD